MLLRRRLALACALATTLLAASSLALVPAAGDGTGNTTAPPDDFGFANLGTTIPSGHTVTYLGGAWVATARHVAEADVVFGGVTYLAVPGSSVLMKNPDDTTADMRIYRLASVPPLPKLRLSTAPVALGDVLTCAGNGWVRRPELHYWDGDWNEVAENDDARLYTGYVQNGSAGQQMRWGHNEVDAAGFYYYGLSGITQSFLIAFDQAGVPEEAHPVRGDSGAGCFARRSGQWEFVGVLHARATNPGQADNHVVFDTVAYGTDVHFYRSQILGQVLPPGVPGLGWAWRLCLAMSMAMPVWAHLRRRRAADEVDTA